MTRILASGREKAARERLPVMALTRELRRWPLCKALLPSPQVEPAERFPRFIWQRMIGLLAPAGAHRRRKGE